MASFMRHKEDSGAIEPFTARGYRAETRIVYRHLGSVRLAELSLPGASSWMRDMGDDGYAPESCLKALRLLKQALKWVAAQGLVIKNPLRLLQAAQAREDTQDDREPRQDDPPKRLETTLSAKRHDAERVARETGVALSDPCAPGTRKERGLPRNPTRLGEDLSAFRRVNGLSCAFHDPRRTLATMMIAGGCDVRTAASCLGHASASMAPDACADVGPEAKRAAADKVVDSLDADLDPLYDFPSPRYGVERRRRRAHVLGGATQGDARRRRGEGGFPWASLGSPGASRAGSSAPCLGGCERALDRIASMVRGERLRACPTKNLPRLRHQSLSQATHKSGT